MKGFILLKARRPECRVNLQTPRQRGGSPKELLVEPVPQPSNCLSDEHSGCHGVNEREQRYALALASNPRAHHAKGDGTPDSQTAFPNLQSVNGVASCTKVRAGRGNDVIDAATDDAKGHGPHGDVCHYLGIATPLHPTFGGQPNGKEDPRENEQRIRVNGEGSHGELRPLRWRTWDKRARHAWPSLQVATYSVSKFLGFGA